MDSTAEYGSLDPLLLAKDPAALRDHEPTEETARQEIVETVRIKGGLHLDEGLSEEEQAGIEQAMSDWTPEDRKEIEKLQAKLAREKHLATHDDL